MHLGADREQNKGKTDTQIAEHDDYIFFCEQATKLYGVVFRD